MNTPTQPLPELEVQLIARRSARRLEAVQILRGDSFKLRRAWTLGPAVIWVLVLIATSRYGEGFATFLGLTKDGLNWVSTLLTGVLMLGIQGFVLERKVKALAYLILDDPGVSPRNTLPTDAGGGI